MKDRKTKTQDTEAKKAAKRAWRNMAIAHRYF